MIPLTEENFLSVLRDSYNRFRDTTSTIPTKLWMSWKAYSLYLKLEDSAEANALFDRSDSGTPSYLGVPISIDAYIMDNLIYFLGE